MLWRCRTKPRIARSKSTSEMEQFFEAVWIEAAFQTFRKQHGIGNGKANREKFLRMMPKAMDEIIRRN